jgi:FKBP-type peptidyl-prolyl cis-trans isomerase (trigger factor)
LLIERLGEQALWEEIAELAIAEAYPHIVAEHKLSVIGRPAISVTKLAPGNPIGFTVETALEPDITLPDYQAIARDVLATPDDLLVTDTEVESVLLNLRKNKWQIDNKELAEKGTEPKQSELPALTDEMVKGLGDFKNVADFTAKLRENMRTEKERKAKERKRIAIGEKVIETATIPLPRILVETELGGMLAQFKSDVERMGTTFAEYLKHVSKTEDDLRKEWEHDATRRAKLQLLLNEIARKENIRPDEKAISHEVAHLKQHMKDADPRRLQFYVMTVLQNELVFQFLETQKNEKLPQS